MKILLVEDDEHLAQALWAVLSEQHHTLDVATDGQKGWELVETFNYDLIVLDVMLPNLDGISLCRRLRSHRMNMPILLLTSRNSSDDKVMGFDAGADDYVVKPFDPHELVARIRALLRRGSAPLPPVLEWGNLRLDPSTCEVSYGEQLLHLTPKEYGLLELFMRNNTRVFSRSAILEQLWSFEEPPAEETVRAHIKGLRQKLKAAGAPTDSIETVYGLGYRLKPLAATRADEDARASEKENQGHSIKSGLRRDNKPESDRATVATLNEPDLPEETLRSRQESREVQNAVSRLWERFREPIVKRVEVVEQAIAALQAGTLDLDLRSHALSEAHKLSGSLGTFGFPEGSSLARQIEKQLQENPLNQDQAPHLLKLVEALYGQIQSKATLETPSDAAAVGDREEERMLSERGFSDIEPYRANVFLPASLFNPAATQNQPSVLLAIDDDPELAQQLQAEGLAMGMRAEIVQNYSTVLEAIAQRPPDVVLLDLSRPDTAEEGMQLLSHLTNWTPPIPVLVLTTRDGFADRLEVARRGGRAFLQKPVLPSFAIEAVMGVLQRFHTHQSKVTIVDDDPQVLAFLQTLLKPWGFKLTTLEDPAQFWDTLEASTPDLLVLDVEMPQLSGIELCQVVRNEPRWSGLPVLFLTAHTDVNTIHQVFASGADDYVRKPIVGPELVTRILNRLERTQLLRSWAETDALTGVANRRKSLQVLEQFLRLSDRFGQTLCLALLDLDRFKLVNDEYGHAVGDAVLRRFGELLLRTFRSEDVVARWGGEEFVVGMYSMSKRDGVKRLMEFLENWRQEVFVGTNGSQFQVTFSAGVVEYPLDGHDLQVLYRAADAALYQAKAAGGDRVFGTQLFARGQS